MKILLSDQNSLLSQGIRLPAKETERLYHIPSKLLDSWTYLWRCGVCTMQTTISYSSQILWRCIIRALATYQTPFNPFRENAPPGTDNSSLVTAQLLEKHDKNSFLPVLPLFHGQPSLRTLDLHPTSSNL